MAFSWRNTSALGKSTSPMTVGAPVTSMITKLSLDAGSLSRQMKETSFRKARAKIGKIDIAEFVAQSDGQFERRAFQVIDQNFQIVRLNVGMLRGVSEKIVRMANDELIERRRRRHQHRAGASTAAAGAAGALPSGGDGSGISGHDHGVERTDIDAEFERAGRNHAADFSIAQAALDFAPLTRQIAATIAANGFRLSRQLRICLLQISEKNFRMQARVREDDRLQIAFQEFLHHARRFVDVAAPNAQRAIHDGRIVKNKSLFGSGCAVGAENFDFGFEKT